MIRVQANFLKYGSWFTIFIFWQDRWSLPLESVSPTVLRAVRYPHKILWLIRTCMIHKSLFVYIAIVGNVGLSKLH